MRDRQLYILMLITLLENVSNNILINHLGKCSLGHTLATFRAIHQMEFPSPNAVIKNPVQVVRCHMSHKMLCAGNVTSVEMVASDIYPWECAGRAGMRTETQMEGGSTVTSNSSQKLSPAC